MNRYKNAVIAVMMIAITILYGCTSDVDVDNTTSASIFNITYNDNIKKITAEYVGNGGFGFLVILKDGISSSFKVYKDTKEYIPLTLGDGVYTIELYEVNEDKYIGNSSSLSLNVDKHDGISSYTGVSYYSDYRNSEDELKSILNELYNEDKKEFVHNIYEYTYKDIEYDYETASMIKSSTIQVYKPDIEKIINDKKGICLDKASLMASLLRYSNIPTKIVFGYFKENVYHSWVEVYIDKEWYMYDSTNGITYEDNKDTLYKAVKYY